MVNSPLIRPYFLGGWHRGGTLRFPWYYCPRDPGSPSENGSMEPKWPMRFVSVIGHPNHPLTLGDWIPRVGDTPMKHTEPWWWKAYSYLIQNGNNWSRLQHENTPKLKGPGGSKKPWDSNGFHCEFNEDQKNLQASCPKNPDPFLE